METVLLETKRRQRSMNINEAMSRINEEEKVDTKSMIRCIVAKSMDSAAKRARFVSTK